MTISVRAVSKDGKRVAMDIDGVLKIFSERNGVIKNDVSRSYGHSAYVNKGMFVAAKRQAAAIINDRKRQMNKNK